MDRYFCHKHGVECFDVPCWHKHLDSIEHVNAKVTVPNKYGKPVTITLNPQKRL